MESYVKIYRARPPSAQPSSALAVAVIGSQPPPYHSSYNFTNFPPKVLRDFCTMSFQKFFSNNFIFFLQFFISIFKFFPKIIENFHQNVSEVCAECFLYFFRVFTRFFHDSFTILSEFQKNCFKIFLISIGKITRIFSQNLYRFLPLMFPKFFQDFLKFIRYYRY